MSKQLFCTQCGASLGDEAKFCGKCGGPISESTKNTANEPELVWQVNVPLINNRFVMLDVGLGSLATMVLTGLILSGIFAYHGGWQGFKDGLIFAGCAGLGLFILQVLILIVFFGNRCPLEFVITPTGVIQRNMSERTHFVNRFAVVLALVTGRPLMAGPGLIARSQEVTAVPWHEVSSVRRYPGLGVIGIRGGLLENIRLYCTQDNYAQVSQTVEAAVRKNSQSAAIF